MKKLLFCFLVTILLCQGMQEFAEALALNETSDSISSINEADNDVAHHKNPHHHEKINCKHACSSRCSKASKRKICLLACKKCCLRCGCVPPVTDSNKEVCPCYTNLKTLGNKPKCP